MFKKVFRLHKSGLYVAEDGEVFVPKSGKKPAHYTYGSKNKLGYRIVVYKGKPYYVHRLVAECFIPNLDGKTEVDHIIPISMGGTNDVSNLRWCTHDENQNNPLTRQNLSDALTEVMTEVLNREETRQKLSDAKKGENHPLYGKHHSEESKRKRAEAMSGKPRNRPIIGTNKETGFTVEFETITDAHITLNINIGNISSCCRGRKKSAGGYVWNYA